eukprot:12017695-Karenia_brevis.AAC.1
MATPDHGMNNPWFGCTWDRKRLGKITKPWSSGDIPENGDNYRTIDCTGYRHGHMTEYTKADGTTGYVSYDDDITLEGDDADY